MDLLGDSRSLATGRTGLGSAQKAPTRQLQLRSSLDLRVLAVSPSSNPDPALPSSGPSHAGPGSLSKPTGPQAEPSAAGSRALRSRASRTRVVGAGPSLAPAALPSSASRLGSLAEEAALETVRLSLQLAECDLAVLDAQREIDLSLQASSALPTATLPLSAREDTGRGIDGSGSDGRWQRQHQGRLTVGGLEEGTGQAQAQFLQKVAQSGAQPGAHAMQRYSEAKSNGVSLNDVWVPVSSPNAGRGLYDPRISYGEAAQRELEAELLKDVLSVVEKGRRERGRGRQARDRDPGSGGALQADDVAALSMSLEEWACSGVVGRAELSNLIKTLGRRGHPRWALEIFHWMSLQAKRQEHRVSHLWGEEEGEERRGGRVGSSRQHLRLRPNGHTFSLVLGILGRAGMVREAEEVFQDFRALGFKDKVHGFNAMLAAYMKRGWVTQAWALFDEMLQAPGPEDAVLLEGTPGVEDGGARWDPWQGVTAGTRLRGGSIDPPNAVVAQGRDEVQVSARPVVNEVPPQLKLEDIVEDPVVELVCVEEEEVAGESDDARRPKTAPVRQKRPSLLEAPLHQGTAAAWPGRTSDISEVWLDAQHTLGTPWGVSPPGIHAHVVPAPDVVSFNTMIGACVKGQQHSRQQQQQQQGASGGVPGEVREGCSGTEVGSERALWLFHDLARRGLKPNVRTFNALLGVLGREQRWQHVQSILSLMEEQGVPRDMFTFNILISTNCKVQRLSQALTFYAEALARGLQPTAVTLSSLMSGYSAAGRTAEALAAFQQLEQQQRRQGLRPDTTAFCGLMAVYKDIGRAGDVEETFRRMVREGARPNNVAYSCLMQAYGREGRLEDATRVFEEMLRSPDSACRPDVQAFNILMAVHGQKGLSLRVAHLFRQMQSLGLSPDTVTYNTLIQAFTQAGQPREAEQALAHMLSAKCKPNSVTRTLLLRAYDEAGWHGKANGLRMQPSRLKRGTGLCRDDVEVDLGSVTTMS